MNPAPRTHLDTLVLLGIGIGLAAWCVISFRAGGYYIQRDVFACQLSGYAALGYLAVSICLGPILRGLSLAGLHVDREFSARFSRNAGISSALAAGLHTVIALTTYLKLDWLAVLQVPYLQWGGLALSLLLILLLGSFKPLMTLVRWKLWKPLFRLSFVAAVLTLPHVLYAPFNDRPLTLALYGGAVLMGLLRWLPERQAAPVSRAKEPTRS